MSRVGLRRAKGTAAPSETAIGRFILAGVLAAVATAARAPPRLPSHPLRVQVRAAARGLLGARDRGRRCHADDRAAGASRVLSRGRNGTRLPVPGRDLGQRRSRGLTRCDGPRGRRQGLLRLAREPRRASGPDRPGACARRRRCSRPRRRPRPRR
jgi:hypothetical protein